MLTGTCQEKKCIFLFASYTFLQAAELGSSREAGLSAEHETCNCWQSIWHSWRDSVLVKDAFLRQLRWKTTGKFMTGSRKEWEENKKKRKKVNSESERLVLFLCSNLWSSILILILFESHSLPIHPFCSFLLFPCDSQLYNLRKHQ